MVSKFGVSHALHEFIAHRANYPDYHGGIPTETALYKLKARKQRPLSKNLEMNAETRIRAALMKLGDDLIHYSSIPNLSAIIGTKESISNLHRAAKDDGDDCIIYLDG